jgi:hypothetical protein
MKMTSCADDPPDRGPAGAYASAGAEELEPLLLRIMSLKRDAEMGPLLQVGATGGKPGSGPARIRPPTGAAALCLEQRSCNGATMLG